MPLYDALQKIRSIIKPNLIMTTGSQQILVTIIEDDAVKEFRIASFENYPPERLQ